MFIPMILLTSVTGGCSSAREKSAPAQADAAEAPARAIPSFVTDTLSGARPIASKPRIVINALLYKTAGDYSDYVPVQLAQDGSLLSFPAPTDIPESPRPVQLADGWLLSPVGVTARSVFTRYTWEEYRALPAAPTPGQLLEAVIPGSGVTATLAAPFPAQEALADTTAVNNFILSTSR